MATGDRFIESVTTKSGARFRVGPCAVEPLSNIAVLDSLDDQVFFGDCEQFVKWQKLTRAVQLANTIPPFGIPIPVHIRAIGSELLSPDGDTGRGVPFSRSRQRIAYKAKRQVAPFVGSSKLSRRFC
jgi:hypothetical protein